jgi:hypothetical protein
LPAHILDAPGSAGGAVTLPLDLPEQVGEHGRVVLRVLRKRLGHDEAVAVHADVELPPTAPVFGLSVLARVPFAGAEDLQSGGVDDQVDRAGVVTAERRDLHSLVAARERSVIGGVEVQLHQAEQRCKKALGLPERQPEDHSQG